jgi:hypothetical protein
MNTNTLNTVYNSMINTMNMVEFDLDSGFILCQNEDYDYTEIGRTYITRKANPTFYLIHDNETHFINQKKLKTIYKDQKKKIFQSYSIVRF